jgi:hypothetical protein
MDVPHKLEDLEELKPGEYTRMRTQEKERTKMKYILLMSGTRAGVEGYHAWPKQEIEAHMARLHRINQDLTESGEFIATQGLAGPKEAKVVRGEKNGVPVTDGIFPEAKEFLLGYWIVEVPNAERAYAIAGRISAVSMNMPIEVRQFAVYEAKTGSGAV